MHEVTLISPFPIYAVPRVWAWAEEFRDKVADDFGPKTVAEFLDDWIAACERGRKSWAVLRDSEIGGLIYSDRLSPLIADVHTTFKREFWGRATTGVALRLACEEIFKSGAGKIETTVFRDNRAALSMGAAVGFSREGLLLGHALRKGRLVDVVVIGLQRSVFDGVNNRRIQQQQHEQPVPEPDVRHVGDHRDQIAVSVGHPAGHLRDAPSIPLGPTSGGKPGPVNSAQPGEPELLRAG